MIKSFLSILISLFLVTNCFAFTVTMYDRSDEYTTNGLTAYGLDSTNTASSLNFTVGLQTFDSWAPYAISSTVDILHSDGSITNLGTNIAQATPADVGGPNEISGTWSCPETTLVTTDAIKVTVKFLFGTGTPDKAVFVTEQLGWNKISASIWTIYYWVSSNPQGSSPHIVTVQKFYWGDSTYDSRIEGINYSLPVSGYAFML